jgi:Mrp family chromosome partitioning ATPase
LLAVLDSLEIAVVVDTVLFVVGSGIVRASQLVEADRLLRQAKVPSIGAVLVGVEKRSDDLYSYGYDQER